MTPQTRKKPVPKFKIAVVDDHPIVRHGLARLLNDTEDLRACGHTGDMKQALILLERTRPDLVIVDLFLHGVIATDLIQKTRAAYPKLAILVLSVQNEAVFAERALRAGADGYVVKEEATHEILDAIHSLLKGGIYVSPKLVDRMSVRIESGGEEGSREFIEKLSNRELQVMKLIGQGANIRQVAHDLELSAKTVETHCARIRKKLQLKNGQELFRLATQWHSQLHLVS